VLTTRRRSLLLFSLQTMINSPNTAAPSRRSLNWWYGFTLAFLLGWQHNALSAEIIAVTGSTSGDFWNLLVAILVCSVAGSVAYLCYFAVRLWAGNWRSLAIAPLLVLAIWLISIMLSLFTGLAPRSLWAFELLLWAMATTVYLVILFTAKRTFEKAETTQQQHSEKNSP